MNSSDILFIGDVFFSNNNDKYIFLDRIRHQLKNYLVIAPDQRGYSSGARPSKIKDYKINKLTKDIIDIADAFKLTNFHLVGHDWGAAVGWVMSSMFKNRIISYSALSVPHLDAFSKAISNDKIQKKKSYYKTQTCLKGKKKDTLSLQLIQKL